MQAPPGRFSRGEARFARSPNRPARALRWLLLGALSALGCDSGSSSDAPGAQAGRGGSAAAGGQGSEGGVGGAGGAATIEGRVLISAASTRPVEPTARGLNYWMWAPSWGTLDGTEAAAQALAPAVLRIGGHANDTGVPDTFDEAEIDKAIAYAQSVGAQPILQVPLLSDGNGGSPTAAMARDMVEYVNTTKSYGVRYFSIGNEPDLYPDPAQDITIPGFTPQDYCAKVVEFASAMRAADPELKLVGPDLSWKYYSGANDWLTPILEECGAEFDVIAVHYYPLQPTEATISTAQVTGGERFRQLIDQLRGKLEATGLADRPLAITEINITFNGEPARSTLDASPGTVPAGLWIADVFGVALEEGLWTTAFWSIREEWTLGFLTPQGEKRPAYHALSLFADHFGPTLASVTAAPNGIRAYSSRNEADDATLVIVVNWTSSPHALTFEVREANGAPPPATVTIGPLTANAVEIPDSGEVAAWTYGAAQHSRKVGPEPIE